MLKLIDIHKTFNPGTPNEKIALEGVNLEMKTGDFVTMVGGNGAGKSTLLNSIAGTFLVDSGTILIDDVDATKLHEHRRAALLGRVFQDPMMGTAANLSIEENLALAYRRGKRRSLKWHVSPKERELYREILKPIGLGLEERLNTKIGMLSGGQRQALTLLMATLQKPKLLLLDEHTAALDPKTGATVLELSQKIVDEHKLTTLMITHNLRDAIHLGNRLIMMHEGKIMLDIRGEEKKRLTVEDLLAKFIQTSGEEAIDDRMILD